MQVSTVQFFPMRKTIAHQVHGGLTQTSKMPCKSYSLPTAACQTGAKMAEIEGSICSECYADKGFYRLYAATIEPAQHARLVSLEDPLWVAAMASSIGSDPFFRWHDAGDLQGLWHLLLICAVCYLTPNTKHWLPTREYAMIKEFIAAGHEVPDNLSIRLSAMYPDVPVKVPASLQGIKGISTSNVHTHKNTNPNALGHICDAPTKNGECRDCRHCWGAEPVTYGLH